MDTITDRELREILFHIDDQKMTVKELRRKLFEVDRQDAPLKIDFTLSRVIEKGASK